MSSPYHLLPLLLVAAVPAGAIPSAAGGAQAPAVAAPAPGPAEEEPLPPIREFDLATLGRLGREIYRHDQIAWHGTDAVFDKIGQAKMAEEQCCGWGVDTSGAEPLLRFVRKAGDGEEAAYDVRFPKEGEPTISIPEKRELAEHQQASRRAFATATAGFAEKQLPLCRCRGSYNFVVLDDPSGAGFLVYLLRPKDANDSIPIGGHYRISVSADGKQVTQIDRLWRSCLTMDRRAGGPEGSAMVAASMSHIVSATPVETHVFLSLQERLPFYVVTDDGRMWKVDAGEIKLADLEHDPVANAKPAP